MSIDTGLNTKFNAAFPVAGSRQSSKGFRDNFSVIKRAIEAIQEVVESPDSVFSVTPLQDGDGTMSLTIGYKDNALILPSGDPTILPVAGMLRYHNGILQIHDGTSWGLISGPSVDDIIGALELDPALWVPSAARHGHMTDPSLHALVVADGAAGFMSGSDKAKLDNLSPSFNQLVLRNENGQSTFSADFGSSALSIRTLAPLTSSITGSKEITIGINIPQALAVANGTAGFISGSDKAKLDSLVITEATTTTKGYMSASDKYKLANLAQSFTRINVNNGPILASDNGSFEIVGLNGISINALPGQQRLIVSLGSIGGYSASNVANVVASYNAQKSRLSTAIPDTANEQLSHTLNQNATVDILFSWDYPGATSEIDGFRITVNNSLSSAVYVIGSSVVTERIYDIPADRRSFSLTGTAPDHYYTFFVEALRYVDTDVQASGLLLGNPRKVTTTGKNPYQPETTSAFTGSLNGMTVNQLFASIDAAKNAAIWTNITGVGKPENGADVTGNHTALNTLNVGNRTAAQIIGDISSLNTNYTSLFTTVQSLQSYGPGGAMLQPYVTAAQLAQSLAQAAAAQASAAFTSISQLRITIDNDATIAANAKASALGALDSAVAASQAAQQASSNASLSATAASGSANYANTKANETSASASAAQASYIGAITSVSQTHPFDFSQDGIYWLGFTTAAQGVTYQDVNGIGRTYRQKSNVSAWITPLRSFVSVAMRRIRATVRFRYLSDGLDANGQKVALVIKGVDDAGGFHDSIHGTISPVVGKPYQGQVSFNDGWQEYAIEFVADSAFCAENAHFDIWFSWNLVGGGLGQIEILTFITEDVTESNRAEVAANATITLSNSVQTYHDDIVQAAQAASAAAASASTASGTAQAYRNDAVEASQSATTASTAAQHQAGIATSAALDSQTYASASSSHSDTAKSEANRAAGISQSIASSIDLVAANSQIAGNAATAAAGSALLAQTNASAASSSASAASLSETRAKTSSDNAKSYADASSVSSYTASTYSSTAVQSASASKQSETNAKSYLDGAKAAAEASTINASASMTQATLTSQFAQAAEQSSISAKITLAALLPSTFSEQGKFWSRGALGSVADRMTLPPDGTYVNDATYGTIFQSLAQAGSIGPVGAQTVASNRIYRVSIVVRAITNNSGPSSSLRFYVSCLDPSLTSELSQIVIGAANPLSFTTGWITYSKDIASSDFGNISYFRPVLYYNQTSGNQLIQVREMRVQDVTESHNAQTAASAAVDTLKTVTAYKDQTGEYATAVLYQAARAQTLAGTASTFATQAVTSASNAEGFSNSASISSGAAAASASLAGQSAEASSTSAQTAETHATDAGVSAAAAQQSALQATTSAGSLLPASFATDGAEWIIDNASTTTYQDVPGYGRTVQITGAGGKSQIRSFQFMNPQPARVYRATVECRYYAENQHPEDQLCFFEMEGHNPDSSTPCVVNPNDMGFIQHTLRASEGWQFFSVDFSLTGTTPSTSLRPIFSFNAGPGGFGDGTIEIVSFRVEDISESELAKGSADAAALTLTQVNASRDAAGEHASVASQQALNAQTSAGNALSYSKTALDAKNSAAGSANTAAQQAGIAVTAGTVTLNATQQAGRMTAQLIPSDFSLDGTFFTNEDHGAYPDSITIGGFITVDEDGSSAAYSDASDGQYLTSTDGVFYTDTDGTFYS